MPVSSRTSPPRGSAQEETCSERDTGLSSGRWKENLTVGNRGVATSSGFKGRLWGPSSCRGQGKIPVLEEQGL